jgi:two-component system, OmpR family, response regulator
MILEPVPHILIVDDEPEICALLTEALTAMGFRVSCAGSAPEARRALDEGDLIDIAIIDAVLPGELGAELAEQVHVLGVPVILISGNPEAMQHEALERVPCVRLSKPFGVAQVAAAVRAAMLAQTGAGGGAEGAVLPPSVEAHGEPR